MAAQTDKSTIQPIDPLWATASLHTDSLSNSHYTLLDCEGNSNTGWHIVNYTMEFIHSYWFVTWHVKPPDEEITWIPFFSTHILQLYEYAVLLHLLSILLPPAGITPGECQHVKQLQRLQKLFLHADTTCRDQRNKPTEDLPEVCRQTALLHVVWQQSPPPPLLSLHL